MACGTGLREDAKYCDVCSAAVGSAAEPAEYKQVTVLFADVVHSMDIAAAVGAERLREIMTELVNRAARVVQRYGGTADKFTGDGIMALFGAPAALEDHAFRARVYPPGNPRRSQDPRQLGEATRRCRVATADRAEFRRSDRRSARLESIRLYRCG